MNETIDAEVVNHGVATRPQMGVGQAMGVDEIVAQVALIQNVMRKVMHENEHYGTIPGCGDKKTLLQPGAQKLTMTFRLAPEYVIQEVNLERGHKEYRIICTLKSMGNGGFVGQGVGCCSTMESKYRWRGGARKCPKCGKETIIKGKAEYGGGWLCFGKKGGCGEKWPDGAKEIEAQSIEKVETDNPADSYNTVLKMAKKRAFVDATITATAASDIFTQDIGDDEPEGSFEHAEPAHQPQAQRPAPAPQPQSQPAAPKPAPVTKPAVKTPTDNTRQWFIEQLGDDWERGLQLAIELGWIMPNESLHDLPLRYVPNSKTQLEDFKNSATEFAMQGRAIKPYEANGVPEGEKAPDSQSGEEDAANEPWRAFQMPFGKEKGVPLGELPKNKLFGWWANYKVETEYNGKPKNPDTIAKDQAFRDMLDAAGTHYEFTKKD
jgi:hypothetical protein